MSARGKHGGLTQISTLIKGKQAGSRHLRRKAEKLAKRHPSEVNAALRILEDRDGKRK